MTVGTPQLRYWIDMTLECVRRDHTNTPAAPISEGDQRGPFLTARAVGMALVALHDANAIAGSRTPLLTLPAPPGLAGSNPIIAGAAACHELLRLRYPRQIRLLDPAWDQWLELHPGIGAGTAMAAGRAYGTAVHLLGNRDIAAATGAYEERPNEPYRHIKPPNQPNQGYAGVNWGSARELLVPRPNFPKPPGRLSATQVVPTQHYQDDFAKVVAKGAANRVRGDGTSRSLEEELIGIFWGYDGPAELGTPPRLYMQVVLTILDAIEARSPGKLDSTEELKIIAGVGIALADAGIHAWHYKYNPDHMMWRPVIGIPKAVPGNGAALPGWLPLGRPDTNGTGLQLTPDFPAYPSGHATFGAAAFELLRLFLVEKGIATFDAHGVDSIGFDFVSDEYNGRNTDPRTRMPREPVTRRHENLWQAIRENSVSRVYLGVHWQFDGITKKGAEPDGVFGVPETPAQLGKIGGVWLGGQIAHAVAPRLGISAATIAASKM